MTGWKLGGNLHLVFGTAESESLKIRWNDAHCNVNYALSATNPALIHEGMALTCQPIASNGEDATSL